MRLLCCRTVKTGFWDPRPHYRGTWKIFIAKLMGRDGWQLSGFNAAGAKKDVATTNLFPTPPNVHDYGPYGLYLVVFRFH